jgi:farnesyl diphosphate synthase
MQSSLNTASDNAPSIQNISFNTWALQQQTHIEAVLAHTLPSAEMAPERLHVAMRYSALNGGKRIRALLCYATAEVCGTPQAMADAAAIAVECIHAYSLVHDDMPCMDDDDLRRGKPSCHKQFDDATALLVGDALQTLAFEVLSATNFNQTKSATVLPSNVKNLTVLPSDVKNLTVFYRHIFDDANQQTVQLKMLQILAKASGSRGMAGGQAIDLASVGKPLSQNALEHMHRLKTGALIEAAVLMSAAHLNTEATQQQYQALSQYARHIGLAFQIVDDILDVEADTATLGKTAGKDSAANKPTFVTILGLEAAKDYAQQSYIQAIDALSLFGESALRLHELAQRITQRNT